MHILVIPVLSSLFDFVVNNLITMLGGISALFMALVTWFAKKYLVPWLQVEKRRRYAEYIAVMADEITDDLIQRYPDNGWMKKLDEAVDKLIAICGINPEIARRAVSAALSRK